MIQIQELLVLMQNQTQIRICESENLSLARAVYSAQITVQATQGEISDNSLISFKTVASGTLKHLRALGLAQTISMRPRAPFIHTPNLVPKWSFVEFYCRIRRFGGCSKVD